MLWKCTVIKKKYESQFTERLRQYEDDIIENIKLETVSLKILFLLAF